MTSFAKAIYDNEAETDNELSFRCGDVIEVLEKDFHGLVNGWWLCYLRGKIGIAPSNRLQMTKIENENSMQGNFCRPSKIVGQRVDGDYDDPRRGSTPTAHHPPSQRRNERMGRRRGEEGGGSCDDLLLSIDSPDDGRKQGRCGGAGGKVKSGAGGSCDDLCAEFLSIGCLSNASSGVDVSRDHEATLAASTAPGNGSGWKLSCEHSVAGKIDEAFFQEERSIGFGQRSKNWGVHGVKAATGVKAKTMNDFLERDSFLTDYDVPRSHRQPPGDKIPIIRNDDSAGIASCAVPKGSKVRDFADLRMANKSASTAVNSNSNETKTSFIAGDRKFTSDLNDVRGAVDHVINYSNRWSTSRNPETVRLIVRQASLSVWTKLQALLTSFSKVLACMKRRDCAVLQDYFGSMKVSAGRIEDILTSIARFRPNEASPDFVKELEAAARDLRTHVDRCVEILTGIDKAPDDCGALMARGQRAPVSSTNQKTENRQMGSGDDPLRPDQVKTMTDVLSCKTNKETASRTFIRDIPTPSSHRPRDPSCLEAAVGIRRADRRHATDDVKVSRGAVVFGEDRAYFRILERRCLGSPFAPSKLVARSSSSDRLDPSESVDYDLPRTRAEAEFFTSGNAGSLGGGSASATPFDDRGVVEFYRVQVEAVLEQLNATYRSVVESLRAAGSDGRVDASGFLATEFRILVVGIRRLGFICDALARSAETSAVVRDKLRSHSFALVNDTRAMQQTFMYCVGAKWQPVNNRKSFLRRIEEMIRHAMVIADILY